MMLAYITGIDANEKTAWLRQQMQSIADTSELDDYKFETIGEISEDPKTQGDATMTIRIAIAAQHIKVLKNFVRDFGGLWLGSLPGFHSENAAGFSARAEFWPGLLQQSELTHEAVLDDGTIIEALMPPTQAFIKTPPSNESTDRVDYGPTKTVLFGDIIHARSGDKGANANIGIWCRNPEASNWLNSFLTTEKFAELIGLAEDVTTVRYRLANVGGVYFVLKGYFGQSGTSNIGLDQIGKALGEFLRARKVEVPVQFLE